MYKHTGKTPNHAYILSSLIPFRGSKSGMWTLPIRTLEGVSEAILLLRCTAGAAESLAPTS